MPARGLAAVLTALLASAAPAAERRAKAMGKPNHLINEKSPYLLQHAYNPVDWRPWGEGAFEKARKENKPILLSIGYSTCHWCHVMERESFSDAAVAAAMNRDFVCIKLDREERPDVDRIYMTAVQAMTGGGGWPLNVFLTPELKPFYGGTYFPPEPRWGQPAWTQLLGRIAELWRGNRAELAKDAAKLSELLQKAAAPPSGGSDFDGAGLDRAFEAFHGAFDPAHAGFGGAPKFPMPVNLSFLLRYHARSGEKRALEMVLATLREMAKGGVYDQVGGGFHRYATDREWRVPHFEKMLYDNSQLATVLLEAHQASGDPGLARTARETLDYVLRDMQHREGGFFSAEDADSLPPERVVTGTDSIGHEEKSEGAFYLWTEAEIKTLLGPDAEIFSYHYGVRPAGNAPEDPHGEFTGKNILYLRRTITETAVQFGAVASDIERSLSRSRARLLDIRAKRPRPGLDDKILTSWNGLMITAMARGAQVLDEPRYRQAAQKAAAFLRGNVYDSPSRRLFHRWREGERKVSGMADDYAFLIQGLIDLYETDFDGSWLDWAVELAETLETRFRGPGGGYFMTAEGHDRNLLTRTMEDSDNVEPSASSVAVLNLLRLALHTGRDEWRRSAEETLRLFGPRFKDRALSLPQMLAGAGFALAKPRQIVIAAGKDAAGTDAMLRAVHRRFISARMVLVLRDERRERLAKGLPYLSGMKASKGRATGYVCSGGVCKLPTSDLKTFEGLLDGASTNWKPR